MPPARLAATWIVLAACATLLAGCGERTPPLPRLDGSAVVLAFGDSLTHGTGASTTESYPAVLERLIGRKVVSAGVPGEVSAVGLERLPEALEQLQPKLLILCHGGNDFLRKLPETQAAANVRSMVKLAKEKGVEVVLVGVPRPGLTGSPAGFYADIAQEFRIPYDGEVLKKVLTDNELKSDWVHPNAKGYARIAQSLAELLKRAKAI
ncbi:MAG TPA: arylesterase [Burkholderiales bacterium]|nr:arylesterase [Burkholderiales bacterium]